MIRRRVTFKIAAATAAALLAGALAACSGGGGGGGGTAASANSPIVVCSDEALSGVYAQIGETDNWGSEAYFKHVNATGGILGHKVTYISLNNQSNAAQSELAREEVHPDLPRAVHHRPGVRRGHRVGAADRDRQQDDPDQPVLRLADQRLPGERAELLRLPRLLRRVRRGPDRLGEEPDRAQALHQGRAARGQLRLGLPGQPGHRAGAWPRRTASSSSPPRSTRSAPPTSPRRCSPCWPPSRRSSSSAWCQAPTRSRPSRPSGRRTRPSRSASAPGCEIPSFVSAAGGPTAMQNIYVLGSMRNWLTQRPGGHHRDRQGDRGRPDDVHRRHAGRGPRQRQRDREQPGRLGRRARDRLGDHSRQATWTRPRSCRSSST